MANSRIRSPRALLLVATLIAGCGDGGPMADEEHVPRDTAWHELFDGETLTGWRRLDFAGHGGEVRAGGGKIALGRGGPFSGMVIADPDFAAPAEEFEIVVRARKVAGGDFFCALTFPVPERGASCTFVAGGWGGGVTGLSDVDFLDANRNVTRAVLRYETGRWYDLRVEVRRGRIRCWVDRRLVVHLLTAGRRLSVRPGGIEDCQPLGLASWETVAEISSVRIRALPPEAGR